MFTTPGAEAQEAMFALSSNHEGADALRDFKWLRDQAERAMEAQVAILRESGETWAYIGVLLGITKQAAQQRYGKEETNQK